MQSRVRLIKQNKSIKWAVIELFSCLRKEVFRLHFAKKHHKEPAQCWKSYKTDETKINLYQNDGKRKVWVSERNSS